MPCSVFAKLIALKIMCTLSKHCVRLKPSENSWFTICEVVLWATVATWINWEDIARIARRGSMVNRWSRGRKGIIFTYCYKGYREGSCSK